MGSLSRIKKTTTRHALELREKSSLARLKVGEVEFSSSGMTAKRVNLAHASAVAFSWHGRAHYIALHELSLIDAETYSDDRPVDRRSDLRGRLTFVPAGCKVWGWSLPSQIEQSFTALYLDPGQLEDELSEQLTNLPDRSQLYFTNAALGSTLQKLHVALNADGPPDTLYLESLCLLAALELRDLQRETAVSPQPAGFLPKPIERRINEYIDANLERDISLDDLSRIAGLSRYHFSRAFKRTTRRAPYQYLLHRRIEQAALLLKQRQLSIEEIAVAVGFKDATRFARTFRRFEGVTPSQLRRT